MSIPTNINASGQYGPTIFTVSKVSGQAAYTTLANAVAALTVNGGGSLYIFPGTYTESIAWPSNVSVIADATGTNTYSVIIVGNQTFAPASTPTSVSFQNIQLSSSSGNTFAISGALDSNVDFFQCSVIATSGFAVTGSSSGLNSVFKGTQSSFTGSLGALSFTGSSSVDLSLSIVRTTGVGTTALAVAGSNSVSSKQTSFFAQTVGGICISLGAGTGLSSNSSSYSAGSGSSPLAAGIYYAGFATAASVNDTFAITDPLYYAKSTVAGGILGYSYTTIIGGAAVIDPQITQNPFIQKPSSFVSWDTVSSSQSMIVNNGYIVTSGSLNLLLPISSTVGDTICVVLDAGVSWAITQGAFQQIRFANTLTTLGVTGSIASTSQGDSVTLICSVANTRWVCISSQGNLIIT